MSDNGKVRVAIIGVGNCANALLQGVEYYRDADPDQFVPGLMHVDPRAAETRPDEFAKKAIRSSHGNNGPASRTEGSTCRMVLAEIDAYTEAEAEQNATRDSLSSCCVAADAGYFESDPSTDTRARLARAVVRLRTHVQVGD